MNTPSAIFTATVSTLATALGEEWFHSNHSPDAFEDASDGAERVHQAFCVWLPDTAFQEGRQPRRGSGPAFLITEVRIRYLYRIRPGNRTADYTSALEAEDTILRAMMNAPTVPPFHAIVSAPIIRRELPSNTGHLLLGELTFAVPHSISVE